MSNYKVKVNNEAESRGVQLLGEELGYIKPQPPSYISMKNGGYVCLGFNYDGVQEDLILLVGGFKESDMSDIKDYKELTIPQLKDLVVLKRNEFKDATHKAWKNGSVVGSCLVNSLGVFVHVSMGHGWVEFKEDNYDELKPIIKPLKEYLVPQDNGKYVLTKATEKRLSDWVEVPEGANIYASANDGISTFWGDEYQWTRCGKITRKASEDKSFSFSDWQKTWSAEILWQRHTQPEALPFVDDEPKSLNDTYADIEQVRQDNVNNPSHYSDSSIECIDAMEAMMTPEQFIGYLRGNVFKYQWRYEKKNGIEDLKKAQWYLDKLVTKVNEK